MISIKKKLTLKYSWSEAFLARQAMALKHITVVTACFENSLVTGDLWKLKLSKQGSPGTQQWKIKQDGIESKGKKIVDHKKLEERLSKKKQNETNERKKEEEKET